MGAGINLAKAHAALGLCETAGAMLKAAAVRHVLIMGPLLTLTSWTSILAL